MEITSLITGILSMLIFIIPGYFISAKLEPKSNKYDNLFFGTIAGIFAMTTILALLNTFLGVNVNLITTILAATALSALFGSEQIKKLIVKKETDSVGKRIMKNTSLLLSASVAAKLMFLFLHILIARILGDSALGQFTFAFSATALLVIIFRLGMNMVIFRDISRDRKTAKHTFSNAVSLQAVLAPIFLIVLWLGLKLLSIEPGVISLTMLFGIYMVIFTFVEAFNFLFRAFEKIEYEWITHVLGTAATLGLGAYYMLNGFGLVYVIYAYIFGAAVTIAMDFVIAAKRFFIPRFSFERATWSRFARTGIYFAVLDIFAIIYLKIDSVMLFVMKGDADLGLYGAAYSLTQSLSFIPSIALTAIFPLLTVKAVQNIKELKNPFENTFAMLALFGVPVGFGIYALATQIIRTIYTSAFDESIIALQILAWSVMMIFLYKPFAYTLFAVEKHEEVTKIFAVGAVFNIIANLVLIPSMSYVGAAVTTLLTEFLILILLKRLFTKTLFTTATITPMIKPLISALVMAGALLFLDASMISGILIGAIIYFATLTAIGGNTLLAR